MQAIEKNVIHRIYGKGRGWSFSRIDFSDLGSSSAIDQSLSRLAKKGQIRRISRGLYDYPKYSQLLNAALSPDVDKIAQAIARKFGWTIQVSGNTALNLLGLSTQVPSRFVYYTDGRSNEYVIGNQVIEFKKAPIKDIGVKYEPSAIVVQAIKALEQSNLSEETRSTVRQHFTHSEQALILKDTRFVTSWIYEEIKRIFKDE